MSVMEFTTRPTTIIAFHLSEARALAALLNTTPLPFGLRYGSALWNATLGNVKRIRVALTKDHSTYNAHWSPSHLYYAELDDWIVQHPNGTLEAVKPEAFYKTYLPVLGQFHKPTP